MNGLDFLEKINDIDDDLLVLERPAVKTAIRRKRTIITLCSAAAVLLILGGVFFFATRGSSSDRIYGKKRSSGSSKSESAEMTTVPAFFADETISDSNEGEQDFYEAIDSAEMSETTGSSKDGGGQSSTTKIEAYLTLGDGGIQFYNYEYDLSDGEADEFVTNNPEILDPYKGPYEDYIISRDGFRYLYLENDISYVRMNEMTFPVYSGGELMGLLSVTKDKAGLIATFDDISGNARELGDFLARYDLKTVEFMMVDGDILVVAPDNNYFTTSDKLLEQGFDYYSSLMSAENTYPVKIPD